MPQVRLPHHPPAARRPAAPEPVASGASRCAVAALAAASLVGCGWVDSTGRQAGDGPAPVPVMLDQIAPGEALVLNEQGSVRLDLSRTALPGERYTWSETPLAEGALDGCAQVPGFRPELAATTLAEACTDPDDCTFDFRRDPPATQGPENADVDEIEDGDGSGETAFVVAAPTLRASIGLRHRLTVATADGATGGATYDFCLVAINEAPDALDDGPFVVVEGTTLVVGADDPENLLANDSDDDDAGNEPLRVDVTPVRAPSASGAFELRADGGFSYSFPDIGIRGSIADSFEYVATDGSSSSPPATVRVTVVPRDLPPVLALPLRPLEVFVGQPFEAVLGAGFSDPEGMPLVFSVIGDPLPPSGSLTFGEDGVLTGTPLAADVGEYDVRFVASDGVRETEGRVTLSIVSPPNAPPSYVAGTIGDIVLARNRFMTPRRAGFVDPEGAPLAFELIGTLPVGLRFDTASGTVFGRPTGAASVTGLQIVATDPQGASASSVPFSIRVL